MSDCAGTTKLTRRRLRLLEDDNALGNVTICIDYDQLSTAQSLSG